MSASLWLIRHGETEWSRSGAHTGRTDLPLTELGRRQALALRDQLAGKSFALILTSPLERARETCRLAGFGDAAQLEPDLREWDYGDYEGLTTKQIRERDPGWTIWSDRVPNGEKLFQVMDRARRVIARADAAGGDVACFSHGHMLRVLAASWLDLPSGSGRHFALSTASVSVLGREHESRVIASWNHTYNGQ